MVILHTNHGDITLELDAENAPATVANFLQYVRDGHYDNTIFHRVIDGFMVQGGGMEPGMKQKPTRATIANEAGNGLKNKKYTVAMARTSEPHSASSQFFINVADNDFLDYKGPSPQGWGYCVFGKVVGGQDVVDRIKARADRQRGHAPERSARRRRAHARRGNEGGVMRAAARWRRCPAAGSRGGGATARTCAPARTAPMKPTLFVSDLHLSTTRPAQLAAFHRFCARTRPRAPASSTSSATSSTAGSATTSSRSRMVAEVAAALASVAASGVSDRHPHRQPRFPAARALRRGGRRDAAARSSWSSTSAAFRR